MTKLLISITLLLFSIHLIAQNTVIKEKSNTKNNLSYKTNSNTIFFENFDKTILPENWTDTIKNTEKTWQFQQLPDYPFSNIDSSSSASAICPWNNDTTGQDEWLISPTIELADSFKTINLSFFAGYSKQWIANADLQFFVGEDQDSLLNWKIIWKASTQTDTLDNSWQWREINKSLVTYLGKKIKIGIRYIGNDGDLVAIDNLSISAYTKSKEANILSFNLAQQTAEPEINSDSLTLKATVLYGTDTTHLVPQFSLSPGANSIPASGDTISVSQNKAFPIIVQADDSSVIKIWNLFIQQAEVLKEAEITSFSLNGQTKPPDIDTLNKIINVELSCTTDLNLLIANFEISPGAKASIQSGDTLSLVENIPYLIEIKAQDTSIISDWQIIASVRDFHTNITNFSLPQQTGNALIDTSQHSIFIEVAFGTQTDSLVPNLSISDCGRSIPASGDTTAFENGVPQLFTVFAKDTTVKPQQWYVTLKIAKNSLFLYGFDVDTINPPVNWTLDSANTRTWTIAKVQDLPFSSIDKRSKFSAICPWSLDSVQNEWLISPIISTQSFADLNLSDLTLEFYLGYNPDFMKGNADVNLYIKTPTTQWKQLWNIPEAKKMDNSWSWHLINKSIDTYIGDSIQFAWQYSGINGDLVALDGISIFSDPIEGLRNISTPNFDLKIYPNPVKSNFTIECKKKLKMRIVDLSGKILLNKQLYPGINKLNTNLQKGFYLLIISDEKGNRQSVKLIVSGKI